MNLMKRKTLMSTFFLFIGDVDKSEMFELYDGLMFCASRNTDRIHLYTKVNLKYTCLL